jgi:hypothetical protein
MLRKVLSGHFCPERVMIHFIESRSGYSVSRDDEQFCEAVGDHYFGHENETYSNKGRQSDIRHHPNYHR